MSGNWSEVQRVCCAHQRVYRMKPTKKEPIEPEGITKSDFILHGILGAAAVGAGIGFVATLFGVL